ncbi:transcriptional regulator TetR [Acidisphaera rubrifaciens HS-AP3]|uniref:Transcriptional regulator TetR n=2 Tax=Acidisphaera TaxID=50714 RepID=A0A0D6P9M1_9PROT|nr:transcriptional regulator TetR [Acidisphaera rubrifaciens HS-AP3]
MFRERGYDGVAIAEMAAAAGFTHGGFYGQFAAKAALADEALAHAFAAARARWQQLAAADADGPVDGDADGDADGAAIDRLLARYLSAAMRDNWGDGCPAVALGMDTARQPAESGIHATYAAGLRGMIAALEEMLPPDWPARRRRERALLLMATMAGALTLARGLGDDPLSDEILATVHREGRLVAGLATASPATATAAQDEERTAGPLVARARHG